MKTFIQFIHEAVAPKEFGAKNLKDIEFVDIGNDVYEFSASSSGGRQYKDTFKLHKGAFYHLD